MHVGYSVSLHVLHVSQPNVGHLSADVLSTQYQKTVGWQTANSLLTYMYGLQMANGLLTVGKQPLRCGKVR